MALVVPNLRLGHDPSEGGAAGAEGLRSQQGSELEVRPMPRCKRALDLVLASLLLVATAPLLLLLMLGIVLESSGSPIFVQQRVGLGGRRFGMFKLRSMYTDAERRLPEVAHLNEVKPPMFKVKRDPRVTRVGRLLRVSSLDELPQLINVIRGEMSLVGPRPPLPREVAVYSGWQTRRLAVTPGLTGLWQVSGRSDVDFDQVIALDLDYIEHWSFWLDVKLILKTPLVVLSSRGAY